MNDWEKFDESLFLEKEDFYSHWDMEDITDADCVHTKRVCKDFETNHHDFYVQSNSLLLANVFENFRNMCIDPERLDIWAWSCKISYISWVSMASSFKKGQSKIRYFSWYQYVIYGRKGYKWKNVSLNLLICKSQ